MHVCAGGVPRHAFAPRNKREQFARESSLHVLRNNCANLKRATGWPRQGNEIQVMQRVRKR